MVSMGNLSAARRKGVCVSLFLAGPYQSTLLLLPLPLKWKLPVSIGQRICEAEDRPRHVKPAANSKPLRTMNWVTIVWSMIASACLTLALVHFLVWCRRPGARPNLLFALMAIATAMFAGCELRMMGAGSICGPDGCGWPGQPAA